jgi:hypothetical protein
MKSIFKICLTLLTYLPLNAIAIAAESKLLDIAGEDQSALLTKEVFYSKNMIFAENESKTSITEAYGRVSSLTGIQDEESLNNEVAKHLNTLLQNGLIQMDESKLTTSLVSGIRGF